MVILGIDPSITNCGLAWLKDGKLMASEVIRPAVPHFEDDKHKGDRRLPILYHAIYDRLRERVIDRVAMEGYSMQSPFNRELMGEVGGVIKLVLIEAAMNYDIWQVQAWRKVCFGKTCKKDEVRLHAFQRYGIELRDEHALEASMVAMASHLVETGQAKPRPKRSRKSEKAPELTAGS